MPERERVAGVQAAVLELVDRAQVQGRQVDELAHARLVEEAVAGDRALDMPEEPAEHEPREADEPGRRARAGSRPSAVPVPDEQGARRRSTARTATARWIERCTANTTAHATKTDAIAHASTADMLRCPNARATAQPGARTQTVPKARRR